MNQNFIKFVVGFMFSPDLKSVCLIRKNGPEWQAGKFNGVGGKVEEGEPIYDAMLREFQEETGVQTSRMDWTWVGTLAPAGVAIFMSRSEKIADVRTTTAERVTVLPVEALHLDDGRSQFFEFVPNLHWIIPRLLDYLRNDSRAAYFEDYHIFR